MKLHHYFYMSFKKSNLTKNINLTLTNLSNQVKVVQQLQFLGTFIWKKEKLQEGQMTLKYFKKKDKA